jgi:hypothetical protein
VNSKTYKENLTRQLIQSIDFDNSCSVDQALKTWWRNIRPNGGMRLTDEGYRALTWADFEHWTVPVDDPKTTMTKKMLLLLDRKLKYPYYIDIKKKHLVLFGSQEAMLATLYGDLAQFLRNYC